MKYLLVGPVYPYKGGISHYTGLMYRCLAKKYETVMVSYKMQYPRFLFKKEQRDYTDDKLKVDDTRFWINTANPFNCVRSALRINKEKPDVVIAQWWHPYFAPCYWIMGKTIRRKSKLFYVCHNVFPHERFPMDRFLTKLVLKNADGYIVQSGQDERDLLSVRANAVYRHAVLPSLGVFKMQDMSRADAREQLGIDEKQKVLLFFGLVREYKGLKHILRAMPQIHQSLPEARLMVVGDFAGAREEYQQIIDSLQISDLVTVCDRYVADNEIEPYFAACDLVVLPYESATQSGVVQVAYGFGRPVVVTDVGGLPEVVIDGETGYVVPPKDPPALADAVLRYFAHDREAAFGQAISREAYKFSWDRMRELVEDMSGEVLHQ